MMQISVTALAAPAPGAAAHEIAERKGRGHPDSICDALAENLSIGLARFYLGLRLADPAAADAARRQAAEVLRAHLQAAPELWRDVLAGRCPVC